jgi:general secretion pathway protein H
MRKAERSHNTLGEACLNGKRRINGFTLIELLIVIVIIGIVSSVALLTLSRNQNKNIEHFAQELVQVITLAEHEAMLRPATLGLGLTATTYQFYIYKPLSQWQPLTDKYFSVHSVPHNIQMLLKMNDQLIELDAKPVIVISESNDLTPFVILLSEPGKAPVYQVVGEANGTIKSEPISEK